MISAHARELIHEKKKIYEVHKAQYGTLKVVFTPQMPTKNV